MKPCDTYFILIHICYKKKGHNTFPMVYAYFCGTQTLIFFFRIFLDNRFNHGLDIYLSGIKSNRGERLQLGPCLIFN